MLISVQFDVLKIHHWM